MVSPFVATRAPDGAIDGQISFQVNSLPELDPIERMLLSTDGTLSDALESIFLEEIIVHRIQLGLYPQAMARLFLRTRDDEEVHEREVPLRGKTSRNNYAYAKSVVAVQRLVGYSMGQYALGYFTPPGAPGEVVDPQDALAPGIHTPQSLGGSALYDNLVDRLKTEPGA